MRESGIYEFQVQWNIIDSPFWSGLSNPLINYMYGVVKDNPVEYQAITANNLKDLFYLLGFGMIATFAALFVELAFQCPNIILVIFKIVKQVVRLMRGVLTVIMSGCKTSD